jgi:hypothetical protein
VVTRIDTHSAAPSSEVVGAANAVSNTLDGAIIGGVIAIVAVIIIMVMVAACVNNRLSLAIAGPAQQLSAVSVAVDYLLGPN